MMKLTFFSFLLSFLMFSDSFAMENTQSNLPDDDKYKVIKVNGQIQIKKTGKNLSQGDEFAPNTPLDFKTAESRAAVISSSKGRFVLTADNNSKGSNLVPAMNSVATRSGAIINMIDLKNVFSENYVIIDEVRLKIGKDAFPMVEGEKFFYVEYEYNGEVIPKILKHVGDTLILSRKEIFTIDGKAVENPSVTELKLYYRDETKGDLGESTPISTFNAVFPDNKSLKEEVKIILDELAKKTEKQKLEDVLSYINEFYGKPDKDNVKTFLSEQFGLALKD
jgi:biopolymer transport protein ExbD